jgi:2-oxoisovalerate dehydrogenase E2 component (dihydrolipoyl transacylase)
VKPGDALAADQVMVSVETDKAIVEVPAPYEGKVEKLFGAAGDKIHVGAPLIGFEGAIEDTGTIVGDLSTRAAKVAHARAPAARTEVKATPAVRALARNLNVDLATVQPTGPGGVATSDDVKRAARGGDDVPQKAQKGLRAAMARNMASAHAEVAAVTVIDDADVERWPQGSKAIVRLARAIIAACRAEPGLNAWYDGKADARTVREEIDLGIAVDLPDGLLVPVLRDAHKVDDLEGALEELIGNARQRSLAPDRLRGATITLSNFGAIGGRYASPIVVPPTVAIIGAGRIERRPVVAADGTLAAHRVLPLSLTFDHRAATGGEAARFLNALKADLQK